MSVLGRAFVLFLFVVLVVGGSVVGIGVRRIRRPYDLPLPPIARATEPGEIARGGRLFRTACLDCHGNAARDRASGARVLGAPEFLGELWAGNLTADPQAGIGAWSDGELARLLRNGVGRDGRYVAGMPRFGRWADPEVAALVGFLRSSDPLVAPIGTAMPPTRLSLAGMLVLAYSAGVHPEGAAHLAAPARAVTVEYGRYLAATLYGCVECHTDGYARVDEKLRAANLLGGGLQLRTPRGEAIYSANLTRAEEGGLPELDADTLIRALDSGIGARGLPLRSPMPVFRFLDEPEHLDGRALFAFVRAVPAVSRRAPEGPPREAPRPEAPAERLFVTLGCASCHGEGVPGRPELSLAAAARTPLPELVASIRHPERRRPGTQMPTYASLVDEATALRLAEYLHTSPRLPGPTSAK